MRLLTCRTYSGVGPTLGPTAPEVGRGNHGHAMTVQPWRIDPMSGGALAWIYVRPHAVAWSVSAAALEAQGYTVTEERQSLVDCELGACVRYLVVRTVR